MKNTLSIIFFIFFLSVSAPVRGADVTSSDAAQQKADQGSAPEASGTPPEKLTSEELVRTAWAASSKSDVKQLNEIVERARKLFGEKAKAQQDSLQDFPPRGDEKKYQELNDFATILFIRAEALMNTGKTEDAIAAFKNIIKNYRWAQAWDPRGWFWSVAEKSQDSIDVMMGKIKEKEEESFKKSPVTVPHIKDAGQQVVDYRKYGEFVGVGTVNYQYKLQEPKALAGAVGEGIYPNTGQKIIKTPAYKKLKASGRLEGDHWSFVQSTDLEAALYTWVRAPEPTGLRLFYIGMIFEKAGMYYEALKAYHALIVHFPRTVGWTYWQTPWYPAEAAVAKIKYIIRTHPELDLKVKWMDVKVKNAFDNKTGNDRFLVWPGVIEKKSWIDKAKEKVLRKGKTVDLGPVVKRVGKGRVQLVRYQSGGWKMFVDGKPFVIKGLTYTPTTVGQSPDKGTMVSWMREDRNHNGKPDGPYDSWVDKNRNNKQDPDEPVVGDFELMKEMGVNVIREYHQPFEPDKKLLREMYKNYGIMVVLGDFLGKYTHGSGASWFEGTDYANEQQKRNMMESVRKMVMEYKDEPYILMWILGNENNYGIASNGDKKPDAYFKFANEVAKMIKSIDPDHPVAICNGDTLFLDKFAKDAPDIDIFAANVYRGDYGFGSFWDQVKEASGKPAFITEYGAPAYAPHMSKEDAERAQADYHRGNWGDIVANMAGHKGGAGNALGGIAFEWTDEWWKNYEPFYHDRHSDAVGPFPGGYYYEEWFGLTSQGDGQSSPYLRQLRPSYFAYKKMWNDQQ